MVAIYSFGRRGENEIRQWKMNELTIRVNNSISVWWRICSDIAYIAPQNVVNISGASGYSSSERVTR